MTVAVRIAQQQQGKSQKNPNNSWLLRPKGDDHPGRCSGSVVMGIVSTHGVWLGTDLSVTLMARGEGGSHPELLGKLQFVMPNNSKEKFLVLISFSLRKISWLPDGISGYCCK